MAAFKYDRDFEYNGKPLNVYADEDDMFGLDINFYRYKYPSDREHVETIAYAHVEDGQYRTEEIQEELDEHIDDIEAGCETILEFIMFLKDLYISGEESVGPNDGWRGPGDTDGSNFKYNWTEEDEDEE